ncbi:MAG: hypothetical protein N2689_14825 [Verrucomicrobiae bacterium]|nr:hypothetical protein [Verrucomicrobiae bacterium]
MIELREDVIIVVREDGRGATVTLEQLARYISTHPTIGNIELWVARQIAHAVMHYFHSDLNRDVVEETQLDEVLQQVLECCCDVIDSDRPASFCADLRKLAVDAGYGFELVFFKALERTVGQLRNHPARLIQFTGLRPCVKLLAGKKNWTRDCSRLETEIVDFLRCRVSADGKSNGALLVVR